MRVVAVLSPVGSALFSSVAAVILGGRCSAPPQFLFCVIIVVPFVLGPHAVEERMSQCFPCCDATLRLIIQELAEQIVEIGVLFSDGILCERVFRNMFGRWRMDWMGCAKHLQTLHPIDVFGAMLDTFVDKLRPPKDSVLKKVPGFFTDYLCGRK